MPKVKFPPVTETTDEGIVAIGGALNRDTLLEAYRQGIFPWPHGGLPMLWFSPPQRGVLDFNQIHVPRSLIKFIKKMNYRFTFNQAFSAVIESCAKVHSEKEKTTWITSEVIEAYKELFALGFAWSVECWQEEQLVGGVYGVLVEGVLGGESMFHLADNASKVSLLFLIQQIKSKGFTWMDTQMVSPAVKTLGGVYWPREKFLQALKRQQSLAKNFPPREELFATELSQLVWK